MNSQQSQLIQFGITAIIVALMTIFLSIEHVFQTTIFFGHAHFIITYIYQYRAGKINSKYLNLYGLILLPLLVVTVIYEPYALYTAIVLIYFVLHFLQDELYIFNGKRTLSVVVSAISVFLIYTGLIIDDVYEIGISYLISDIVVCLIMASYLINWIKKIKIQMPEIIFHIISLFLVLLVKSGNELDIKILLGSITLFHYIRWYIFYYLKVKNDSIRLKQYVLNCISVNVVVIILYSVFVYNPLMHEPLRYIYGPVYFLMWTIMHITFSIRVEDYKIFSLKKNEQ